MPKLDNIRRLIEDDFEPEQRPMIRRLGFVVNTFMENVVRQVNGKLDFSNLSEDLKVFKITVNASGVPLKSDKINTNITNPSGLTVIKARNITSPTTYPTEAPWISFEPVSGSRNILKINKITGLPANNEFELTIRVVP